MSRTALTSPRSEKTEVPRCPRSVGILQRRDGSGKCSITPGEPGSVVHGGLFRVPRRERHLLDAVEGLGAGYELVTLEIELGGRCIEAWTYRAQPEWVDHALRPFVRTLGTRWRRRGSHRFEP